ncbi:hypothetical protein IWX90DRAFT_430292 [Phyllosticta citrichinensis]|uniref:Uncharacterized protein n=1 Tax=Phyllosticta citrichinensis TaxID=1130410 RepID=A0ABR1XVX1_9PEZI
MEPPNLPGFYYDPEKKKYFKIQKNHHALPGSKYSQDAVNKQETLSKKRKREGLEKAQREAQTLKRSPMLINSASWTLTREVQGLRSDPNTRAKALASVFEANFFLELHDYWYRLIHPSNVIRSFDYDPLGLTLITGISGSDKCLASTFVDPHLALRDGLRIYRNINGPKSAPSWHKRTFVPTHSDVTSVTVGPNRTLLYTTLGGSSSAEVHLSSLNAHLPSRDDEQEYVDWYVSLGPHDPDTIWTSTANKFVKDKDVFTVGTSSKVVNVENGENGVRYRAFSPYQRDQRGDKDDDALALDWLSPNVLASGFRSGNIVLYDLRTRDSALRLSHPSSVIGIRRGDSESRLVVAGLRNNMNLYDLRMAGPYNKKKSSRSVFRFKYSNEYTVSSGLDVHPESGVVAAAQGRRVQLYSIKNGAQIRHFDARPTQWHGFEYPVPPNVTCLRFVEEVTGPEAGRTKLLGSIGTRVVQFR